MFKMAKVSALYIMDYTNQGLDVSSFPLGTVLIWVGNVNHMDHYVTKIGENDWLDTDIQDGNTVDCKFLSGPELQAQIDELYSND